MPELTKRERMALSRTAMPMRDPATRSSDFDEVNLGFSSGMAVLEASRCLNCKRPVCIEGCPVGVRIDEFVALVAEGDVEGAADIIKNDNTLPGVCGRVCPQESQCERACVLNKKDRPIAIGHLERFVADQERMRSPEPTPVAPPSGHSVAIVGSGPAGLACAGDLIKLGHAVTVFEALHELGGVLAYGIPTFRLPKAIVQAEIAQLADLGVEFETDVVVGSSVTVDELLSQEGFDALFVGTGAGLPRFPGIEGEDLIGVYSANEFLTRVNLMGAHSPESETPVYDLAGRPAVVIGGGNTAVDAARTALRLGADPVTLLYRRSEAEMPAREEEVAHAKQEGVTISLLAAPVAFVGTDGWLTHLEIQHMRLGDPDSDGRRQPLPLADSNEMLRADVAIVAIGNRPNPVLTTATPALATTSRGTVEVDRISGRTSIPRVFAGGDITTGGATVILALAAGRRAARAIDEMLSESSAEAPV
ncbi:MAG: NADPH-dependent glutamate synthase [Acidimicrobiia bacterium]